jgi:hypothetical protein
MSIEHKAQEKEWWANKVFLHTLTLLLGAAGSLGVREYAFQDKPTMSTYENGLRNDRMSREAEVNFAKIESESASMKLRVEKTEDAIEEIKKCLGDLTSSVKEFTKELQIRGSGLEDRLRRLEEQMLYRSKLDEKVYNRALRKSSNDPSDEPETFAIKKIEMSRITPYAVEAKGSL